MFGKQSRLVVVLYRAGWGKTPWTRIEETAIRNRAYNEGYSFVLFVPLEEKPSVPAWLPKTQLWIGFNRWGVDGIAPVVDARFQELGGTPHEESIEDRAVRLEKAVNFESLRQHHLKSEVGVKAADAAYELLVQSIIERVPSLQTSAPSLGIEAKQVEYSLVLLCTKRPARPALSVTWIRRYINTLENTRLETSLWLGHPPFPHIIHYEEPQSISTLTFAPDILRSGEACWSIQEAQRNKSLLPVAAAEFIVSWWLEQAIKDQSAKR